MLPVLFSPLFTTYLAIVFKSLTVSSGRCLIVTTPSSESSSTSFCNTEN